MSISKEIQDIIKKYLEEGKDIPLEFKDLLFPNIQKEYLLSYSGKMRKEDIFANLDGVSPCPLQIDKVFNDQEHTPFEDGWKNILVFGDNLQLLKTIYENKDSLIKNKIKGKVKLIYIDPPFATEEEFNNTTGAKAYADKKKGAEFTSRLSNVVLTAFLFLKINKLSVIILEKYLSTKKSQLILYFQ